MEIARTISGNAPLAIKAAKITIAQVLKDPERSRHGRDQADRHRLHGLGGFPRGPHAPSWKSASRSSRDGRRFIRARVDRTSRSMRIGTTHMHKPVETSQHAPSRTIADSAAAAVALQGDRPDAGARRPVLRAHAGRLGRRRDPGRAAAGRRRGRRAGRPARRLGLPEPASQQARHHAEPEDRRGPRNPDAARRTGRRRRREHAARRHQAARRRLSNPSGSAIRASSMAAFPASASTAPTPRGPRSTRSRRA